MVTIKYTNKGIAYRLSNSKADEIFINEALLDYPELYEQVLKHELEHSPKFNIKDLWMDLLPNFRNAGKWIKFMFKNPKALLQFSIVWKYNGRYYIDFANLLLFLVFILILIALPYIAMGFIKYFGG